MKSKSKAKRILKRCPLRLGVGKPNLLYMQILDCLFPRPRLLEERTHA